MQVIRNLLFPQTEKVYHYKQKLTQLFLTESIDLCMDNDRSLHQNFHTFNL